jgi:ABC-type thiamine transport system substrate-binding protein
MTRNFSFKKFLFFFNLFTGFCWSQEKIKILTYSSFMEKGGLGEWIKKQNPALEFSVAKDFSGIIGELRKLKRHNKLSSIDVVLGLNQINYQNALQENLIDEGTPFEKSSYTILINKKLLNEKEWPKNWKELATKFTKKLLVQDPRTSEIGLAWLLNSKDLSNLSLEEAKKIPLKVFPKWSSSFAAFENEMAPMIWTYATSLAYYECKNKNKFYANLPLENYPSDTNYLTTTFGNSQKISLKRIIEFLKSNAVQEQVWQKNWMFPASEIPSPPCFKKLAPIKHSKPIRFYDHLKILGWLDEWSL